jgi:ferrous iron transport protein B
VTVERRTGEFEWDGVSVEVVDLPGTYSLSTCSEDERIAASYLVDPEVDLIVNVLDASNLERNLYLTTQLLELGKPLVFALNMQDDADRKGVSIDLPLLQALLGGPVLPTIGNRAEGIRALKESLLSVATGSDPHMRKLHVGFGEDIEKELLKLQQEIQRDEELVRSRPPRWLAIQILDDSAEARRLVEGSHARQAIQAQAKASSNFLEQHLGADVTTLLAEHRYGFVHGLMKETVHQSTESRRDFTERLDGLLTHRWLGIPIFIAVMVGMYTFTFVLGKYPQDWIAKAFSLLHDWASLRLPAGEMTSLLVDGVIPGVGAVVVFVPVIMLLMGCIAFLEDTGYMARAAFIMDRLMHLMGLHGKSFIPLVMGMGCNVPAIQATRTIEARADRLITILVAPMVSCSARLQVFILIAGTFFPPVQAAFVIIAMHFLGFGLAMLMGKVLRWTFFRSENTPFVMELPPYRMPVMKSTFIHMWEKGSVFLSRAGTTILAGATLVWFLSHYPGVTNRAWMAELHEQQSAVKALHLPVSEERERMDDLELRHQGRIVNTSLAATFGRQLQPLLAPILDPERNRPEAWKDGIALTAGFVAKEIVVSTLAVVHQTRASETEKTRPQSSLQEALLNRSGLTPLAALAFMVFVLIYSPCLGTVSIIHKETGSLVWTSFSVVYSLGLAWLLSWITVLVGHALGFR